MTNENRFLIKNERHSSLLLNIEPEAVEFQLARGEEVTVCDSFESAPVTLQISELEDGTPIISIWPGDGKVRVEKDGVEIFDLV